MCVLDDDVGGEHPADEGVVQSSVHVDEPKVVVVLVQSVTAVEGGGDVFVGQRLRVAAAPPRVEAVMRHGAACYGGIQAALVVFDDNGGCSHHLSFTFEIFSQQQSIKSSIVYN